MTPTDIEPGVARGFRDRRHVGAGLLLVITVALCAIAVVSGRHIGPSDQLSRLLAAVTVILLSCHLLGTLLARFGQPRVIGEVLGGLLLGPSFLGSLWPSGEHGLFAPDTQSTVSMIAQLGLEMFLFLLGCELRLGEIRSRHPVLPSVVLVGIGLPFAAGAAIAVPAHSLLTGTNTRLMPYAIFFGLAIAITALPVLARLLMDTGKDGTALGGLALTCAAIGDGVTWGVLTLVIAATHLNGAGDAVTVLAATGALVLLTLLCVRPALAALVRKAEAATKSDGQALLVLLVAGALGYSALTQLIGLHAAVGAFLFGTIVPRNSVLLERIGSMFQGFTLVILLPLFFAGIGLDTSVGLLGSSPTRWAFFCLILVVAMLTKMAGVGGGARLAGIPTGAALRMGILMNCRGVTELVVASIGWQYRLINSLALTILVLMAIVTTIATAPLLKLVDRRTDREADSWNMRKSGIAGG